MSLNCWIYLRKIISPKIEHLCWSNCWISQVQFVQCFWTTCLLIWVQVSLVMAIQSWSLNLSFFPLFIHHFNNFFLSKFSKMSTLFAICGYQQSFLLRVFIWVLIWWSFCFQPTTQTLPASPQTSICWFDATCQVFYGWRGSQTRARKEPDGHPVPSRNRDPRFCFRHCN